MNNIITATFGSLRKTRTRPAWIADHGMILRFAGIELPAAYEVHFSNSRSTPAKVSIGDESGVEIPDEYFHNADQIFAWLYLHTGEDDGYTVYEAEIPLIKRPEVTDEQPTPQQESAIEQAIIALNIAVEQCETNVSHYPMIVNDYWVVWDAQIGQFVNTGVRAKGENGRDGADGRDGRDGTNGAPGEDGEDGFSPVVTVEEITGGHRVTITDAQGDHVFDVMDGENGADGINGTDGVDGKDGISPTISSSAITGGHRLTIVDAEGTTTVDVMDGQVSQAQLLRAFPTDTASGALASFQDGADSIPVKALTVSIRPVQSGSGDPTPNNVRPISGWTQAKIWREITHDTTADPILTIDLDGTIYGGTLDVTTGVLTVNKGIVDLGSLSWEKFNGTQTAYFRASVPGIKPAASSTSPDGISCSAYNPTGSTYVSYSAYPYSIGVTSTQTANYIYVQDLRWDNADDFKTNASGVMFVYPLKNPQTVQLTPAQLATLAGENNVWADTGDVSVTYRADPTLYKPTYTKSDVGLGNVDNVKQYSANNPPPYPVTSVNNQTGAVSLSIPSSASDVGAVAVAQGVSHAGEFLVVGSNGNVTTVTLSTWQGGSY